MDRTQFVERVSDPVLDQILDTLHEHRVINDGEMESLRDPKNRANKARKVFDSVRKKGAYAWSVLREALRKKDPNLFKVVSKFNK